MDINVVETFHTFSLSTQQLVLFRRSPAVRQLRDKAKAFLLCFSTVLQGNDHCVIERPALSQFIQHRVTR